MKINLLINTSNIFVLRLGIWKIIGGIRSYNGASCDIFLISLSKFSKQFIFQKRQRFLQPSLYRHCSVPQSFYLYSIVQDYLLQQVFAIHLSKNKKYVSLLWQVRLE